MAHVEDRWSVPGPNGKRVKGPRWGVGQRWAAVWTEPDGTRRKKACATKDAALAHIAHVSVDLHSGQYVSAQYGQMTVGEWAAYWVTTQAHLKPSGRERVEGIVSKHITPRWGRTSLADVTHQDVQRWVQDLDCAAATAQRIHGVLAKLLDAAVRARRITTNPARGINRPQRTLRDHRYLTVDELDRLLEHSGLWAPATRCLALTGMRIGEVAELRVRDVDLTRRRASVTRSTTTVGGRRVTGTPKSAAGRRSVPLPDEVLADMTALVQGKHRDDLVFTTPRGAQLQKDNYRRAFTQAATAAGLEGVRPHDLRHTAVSLAVTAGASVKTVQRMVGHASAAITLDVYAGLFDQELDDVMERVDAFLALQRSAPRAPMGSRQGADLR